MPLKRRQVLTFGGLGGVGLGLALVGKSLGDANPPPLPASPLGPPKPAGKDLSLRFVAVADTGAGDRNQYASANAMARYHAQHPYELVVMAGDNIYTNGEMEKIGAVFEQPYKALLQKKVRFQASLGNHDIRTANGDLQVRYPAFHMKGRYYTYSEKSAQFFVLDTNTNADWPTQLAWLDRELGQSRATLKVVYGHHPIYSSGRYGTSPEMIQTLTPLFKKHGVQLYINGHEHHYERTRPIEGTTYLITGIGGATLRDVGRSAWTDYAVSRFGFSVVEVYPDRFEIQGIGTDGLVFDRGVVPLKVAVT